MHPYVLSLKKLYEQNANPAQAGPMKKYMRDQFEYLGIKSPQSRRADQGFIKQNGLPPLDQLDTICVSFGHSPSVNFNTRRQVW